MLKNCVGWNPNVTKFEMRSLFLLNQPMRSLFRFCCVRYAYILKMLRSFFLFRCVRYSAFVMTTALRSLWKAPGRMSAIFTFAAIGAICFPFSNMPLFLVLYLFNSRKVCQMALNLNDCLGQILNIINNNNGRYIHCLFIHENWPWTDCLTR